MDETAQARVVRRVEVEHVPLDGLKEAEHPRQPAQRPAPQRVPAVLRQARVFQQRRDVVIPAHEPDHRPVGELDGMHRSLGTEARVMRVRVGLEVGAGHVYRRDAHGPLG